MKATEKKKEVAPEKNKVATSNFKYNLKRKSDGATFEANEVCYVFWKANGTFQAMGNTPTVGTSLAMDLEFGVKSTHVTDQITNILESTEESLKFETKDGAYELTIAK